MCESSLIEMRTGPPAYRLEPLTGEPMVLYQGPSTRNLGFVFAGCEPTVLHPDPGVFASIGMHAFALRREEPGNGRKGRDRVTVFEDTRLPIAPEPDEDSDARWLTF